MAHNINGIITSFKYEGKLPNVILVGNYHLIPFKNRYGTNCTDKPIAPYEELTSDIRNEIKNLSFYGKCAYIETEYFGGTGVQLSETWENGKITDGPLVSFDGVENTMKDGNVTVVDNSINQTLKNIGIQRHEGKDEFDTVRLGHYWSNSKIFDEYENKTEI